MTLAFRVTGRVQRVGFRDGTVRLGRLHGVVGWVRNVGDGSVEGRVHGTPEAVQAFLDDLPEAAPHGRVDGLQTRPCESASERDFGRAPTVSAGSSDWR